MKSKKEILKRLEDFINQAVSYKCPNGKEHNYIESDGVEFCCRCMAHKETVNNDLWWRDNLMELLEDFKSKSQGENKE